MRRSAFTLVELLAVIAIVGLLAALLLPAVQAARESSRQSTCANNIRQIGHAMQLHHQATNVLPEAAAMLEPLPGNDGTWEGRRPWTLFVMPFLERGDTAASIRSSAANSMSNERKIAAEAIIPTFICPSDVVGPLETMADYRSGLGGGWANASSSKLNYLGNGGPLPAFLAGNWPTPPANPTQEPARASQRLLSRGAIRKYGGLPFAAVTDGLSNTFLVGEAGGRNNGANKQEAMPGLWATIYRNDDAVRTVLRYSREKPNSGSTFGFGSFHPGGVHFVMCDGAVRFIVDEIGFNQASLPGQFFAGDNETSALSAMKSAALGVYQRLATRDDGVLLEDY